MTFASNRSSSVIVSNSITSTDTGVKLDSNQPFSFIEFLNYTRSLDRSIVEFTDYKQYLKLWNEVTTTKYTDLDEIIRQEFIAFIKSITLNYTTAEEKRYLSNINFEDKADMEIATPFYVAKIKEVLLYFASKRDTYILDLQNTKNKGSIKGISNYLHSSVVDTIIGNDLKPAITLTQPISTINTNLKIVIEEGYDIFNDYFDLDPFAPGEFYNAEQKRLKYFTSNTNYVDKNINLDLDQAIIDLINSEGVALAELPALIITVNTPDLDLLQDYDFLDYNTRTRANLRLLVEANLSRKFTGTDFYYLSTNTAGESVSGKLFEATSPYANLLNIYNPTSLTVPQPFTKYERDVGLFFKPTNRSILKLQTPFTFSESVNVQNDFVYIFPDPYNYGNVSGLTKTDHVSPFDYNQQGNDIQKNVSSGLSIGHSLVTPQDFTFESYHSQKGDDVISKFANSGVVSNYNADIYGNVYFGLKQQGTDYVNNFASNVNSQVDALTSENDVVYVESIKRLTSGTFNNTSTRTQTSPSVPRPSIYHTRTSTGVFMVHNLYTNEIDHLSTVFVDVFDKYPTINTDLDNALVSFNVYGTTFVATTTAHIVIDKFEYEAGVFSKSVDIPYLQRSYINYKHSNEFIIDNTLYVASCNLDNAPTSGYNLREFILGLHSFDLSTGDISEYTFSNNSQIVSYQVQTLVNVIDLKLSYSKRQDAFNLVLTLKDISHNLFIHSVFFRIIEGVVNVIQQKIFTPNNSNFTINFYDLSYTNLLLLNTLSPTVTTIDPSGETSAIDQANGTLTF